MEIFNSSNNKVLKIGAGFRFKPRFSERNKYENYGRIRGNKNMFKAGHPSQELLLSR